MRFCHLIAIAAIGYWLSIDMYWHPYRLIVDISGPWSVLVADCLEKCQDLTQISPDAKRHGSGLMSPKTLETEIRPMPDATHLGLACGASRAKICKRPAHAPNCVSVACLFCIMLPEVIQAEKWGATLGSLGIIWKYLRGSRDLGCLGCQQVQFLLDRDMFRSEP